MRETAILAAVRTPFTRAFTGGLGQASEFDLAKSVIEGSLVQSGLPPEAVDDVALGEVYQGGGCIARYAALDLGLPVDTPGVAIGGFCASGMLAIHHGVAGIRSGMSRAVIAGGVTSVTHAPVTYPMSADPANSAPVWSPSHPSTSAAPAGDLTFTIGEATARSLGIGREELDEWAVRAHALAVSALDKGIFDAEKVSVRLAAGGTAEADELPQRGVTAEGLRELEPVLGPGNTVTVGNQTGLTDGAAALCLSGGREAGDFGIKPLGFVTGWGSAGVEPNESMSAAFVSVRRALTVAGVRLDDVDLFEIHDSFAVIGLAFEKGLEIEREKINVLGGGLALGHPFAGSGARTVVTLVHELQRRGGGTGLAAILGAGGLATATVVQV
ncbi:thiolase family protein [Rhodococcus sp. BE178]|uniref:thiolase family protein n=1 Tax=Rhodococcus sp. BE178 TaxID=2817737 RepID=UPI003D258C7C